jgi:hypothetical protein
MSDTHKALVVRIGEVLPHPNADKLEITFVGGYQCVTGKGNFNTGDIAVYIQPDSVVPQTEPFRFIWNDHVGIDGTVPEKRRRITVKRLRKEYSEGLLMPYDEVVPHDQILFAEGTDVSELIGVTHYVPEFDRASTASDQVSLKNRPHRRYPKTLKGWFFFFLFKLGIKGAGRSLALEVAFNYPVYDVDALKNNKRLIKEGDLVHVTEKIHGSNARYVFVDGVFYAGSRQQWKQKGDNVWWQAVKNQPEIEEFCTQNPGVVLYGEVVPTQKGFNYGSDSKEDVQFFAFDVWKNGSWRWPGTEGFAPTVPVLDVGLFAQSMLKLADGESKVPGAKHMREGCVIRRIGKTSADDIKLKVVSNRFLEADNG